MRSNLTNRLLMVRLAHRSNNEPLFQKNLNECLTLANEYDKMCSITDEQEQELFDYPWFDCASSKEFSF